jgi:Cu(I)/Ag(I) efflux system membrane fusion protein
MEARGDKEEAVVVTASGTIRDVFSDKALLNIDHDPIDVLGWPAMKMDFKVADTVDLDRLQSGQTIDFELTKQGESGYVVTAVSTRSAVNGPHDHSAHQHTPGAVKMQPEDAERVTTTGEVRKLIPEMNKVEIVHDPIPEWKWPAMTMSFTAADPDKLESLTPGQRIRFTLTKTTDGDYLLSNPEPID